MSDYRAKLPSSGMFHTNSKKWEEQLHSFLILNDLDEFVDDYKYGMVENFIKDNADPNKVESINKWKRIFRRCKKKGTEAIWISLPKAIQKLIPSDHRKFGSATSVWIFIQKELKISRKNLEVKLLSKWNELTLDSNPSRKLNQFEKILGDLKEFRYDISGHVQLHKFKSVFKSKFSILIQTIELDAADKNLDYDKELVKLKNSLRNHINRNT